MMVNLKSPQFKITFWLVIMILVGILCWLTRPLNITNSAPISGAINQPASPPPPLPAQPKTSEVHSGDGTMNLIRKVDSQSGKPSTYTFFVANLTDQDKNERLIFTKTVNQNEEISIPGNSWSPDNKHVFLQVKNSTGDLNFLVFKASGETFANDEPYLDVGATFTQKISNYLLTDATGWASPIFLNITTEDNEAKKGPSYWFDIQAQNFWGHR